MNFYKSRFRIQFFIGSAIFLFFAILVGCSKEISSESKQTDLLAQFVSSTCNTISIDSLNSSHFFKEKLYDHDTSCIEYFIDNIDTDKRGEIFPVPVIQSILHEYEINNYLGLRYVLTINAYFSDEECVDSLYGYYPILFPVVNGQVVKDTISRNDIEIIESMYFSWWSKNKSRDIETIRDSFSIDSVLKGKYRYQWRSWPVRNYR